MSRVSALAGVSREWAAVGLAAAAIGSVAGLAAHFGPAVVGVVVFGLLLGASSLLFDRVGLTVPELLLVAWLIGTAAFGRLFAYVGAGGLYATEVLLAGAFYTVFLTSVVHARSSLRVVWEHRAVLSALLLLLVLAGVQMVRGYIEWGPRAVKDSVLLGYAIIIMLPLLILSEGNRYRTMARLMVVAGIVSALVYLAAKSLVFAGFIDSAKLQRNLVSQVSATYFGSALLAVIVGLVSGLIERSARIYAVLGLLATAAVVAESRASWLGLAIAFGVIWLLTKGRRGALLKLLVVAGLATAVLVTVLGLVTGFGVWQLMVDEVMSTLDFGRDTTLNRSGANARFRLLILAEGLARFVQSPIVGEGFGAPGFIHWRGSQVVETSFHNSHLAILVRSGLVGYAAFLLLMGVWWRKMQTGMRLLGVEPMRQAVAMWCVVSIVYMLASFSFFHALEAPYVGPFFWLVAGLGLVATHPLDLSAESPSR